MTICQFFPQVGLGRCITVWDSTHRVIDPGWPGFNSLGILAFWKALQSEPEQRLMATKVPEGHRVHFCSVLWHCTKILESFRAKKET